MLPGVGIKNRLFYGWVMVGVFLVISAAIYGANNSAGVFFKSIEGEFGLTRALTSGVFSVQMALSCIFAILSGWALDKYGPRIVALFMGSFAGLSLLLTSQANELWQLFISYSMLSAGAGAVYSVMMGTISRWFDKRRGLALGVGGSGAGLGTVVVAPFATYLISNFGWRMAYMLMGLIIWLIVIPLSTLLRRNPYDVGTLPDAKKPGSDEVDIRMSEKRGSAQLVGFSLPQAFRTGNFWYFGSIWLLHAFTYLLVLTHIVPHATDIGIPALEAAANLSLIGGSSIAGRLLVGRVSDIASPKIMAIACALVQAGAVVGLVWSQDRWMLYLLAAVFGFCVGGLDPSVTALISGIFGLRNIGIIIGSLGIAWWLGAALGPATGGLIFDATGSYSIAFSLGALAVLLSALLIALTKREAIPLSK